MQEYLPRMAELAWQLSRGSVNFKINSRPLFTIIFKLKNYNFKPRDFSPLIERVLAGVYCNNEKDVTYLPPALVWRLTFSVFSIELQVQFCGLVSKGLDAELYRCLLIEVF